jgi:hypothetical protein
LEEGIMERVRAKEGKRVTETTPIMAEWAVRLLMIDKVGIDLLWRGVDEMRGGLVEPSSEFSRLLPAI